MTDSVGYANTLSYPTNVTLSTNGKGNTSSTPVGYTLGKADFAQYPMSIRKFLEPFDHSSLTDAEAGSKYAAYKTSFARQQLEEFFERNKNSPWFREKYHPDMRSSSDVKAQTLKHRLNVFMELYESHKLDNLVLSGGNELDLVKILDTIGIKLLGGTDEDVAYLEEYARCMELISSKVVTPSTKLFNPEASAGGGTKVTALPPGAGVGVENIGASPLPISALVNADGVESERTDDPAELARLHRKKRRKMRDPDAQALNNGERRRTKDVRTKQSAEKKQSSGQTCDSDREDMATGDDEDDGSSSSSGSSDSGSGGDEDSSSGDESSSSSGSSASDSSSSGTSSSDSDTASSSASGTSPHGRRQQPVDNGATSDSEAERQPEILHITSGQPMETGMKHRQDGRDDSSGYEEQSEEETEEVDSNDKLEGLPAAPHQGKVGVNGQDMSRQITSNTIAQRCVPNASTNVTETDSYATESAVGNAFDDAIPKKHPLHHTKILFLPHIPFSVYQNDLNALFSTSPHFLRLAVLDPFLMPSFVGDTTSSEFHRHRSSLPESLLPEVGPDGDQRSSNDPSRGLPVLRRVGWATFAFQALEPEEQQWIDVDAEAIRTKLLQQATEAQAPPELLNCLRNSKVIVDNLYKNSGSTRIRTSNHLMSKLMEVCPLRLYSKSLLRRHLVLAARLVYDLDRFRGLWQKATDIAPTETSSTDDILIDDETGVKESTNDPGKEPQRISTENSHRTEDTDIGTDDIPTQVRRSDSMPIDPGEDLLLAATILGSLISPNPLLHGLTDYLVDEGSAEEELLLAGGFQSMSFLPTQAGISRLPPLYTEPACESTELVQALDRLIFYLRVVHSVDFYAPALYVNEDCMPHPCRLMHVRPNQVDVDKAVARLKLRQQQQKQLSKDPELQYHQQQTGLNSRYEQVFSNQLNRLLRLCRPLSEADCRILGFRNVEDVVEAFVQANTKRKKRKTDVIWVCPLSDKKFRDPIYVRKHIMNKHMEKIEAAKKDNALFFNNYLMDPARPQLPLEPRPPKAKRQRKGAGRQNEESISEDDRPGATDAKGTDNFRNLGSNLLPNWPYKGLPIPVGNAGSTWLGNYNRSGIDFPDRVPLPFMTYRQQQQQQRFPQRLPFYPQQSMMGVRISRLPFNPMRGSRYMSGMRRGFSRRPYVDLDAP